MLIPMYLIIVNLRLKDSYLGLIIANMSFSVPFCTWLMIGYLRSISSEIEEASLIDGCTRLLSLWHIRPYSDLISYSCSRCLVTGVLPVVEIKSE